MSRYRQSMSEALQQVVSDNETFDEAMKWEVKISGLPTFYSDGKSKGQVRQALRKMLKRPDDIESIERTTPAALKKIRRDQAKGEGEDVKKEEVEDAYDYKAKKGAIAAPGSGSIAKAKKAKATDVNKSIEQQMKDALKEHIKDSIKEKSGVDADGVVNMIQFGHPFKVVDEEIPPELPGPETRRYANVSNAVVDKADKKSNKAMAKAQKGTLVPTQTRDEEVEIDEGNYQVKTATHRRGRIAVKEFDSPEDAKKHLEKMRKKGHQGLVSQGGKPIGEDVEIDEQKPQHPGQKKGSAKLKKGWGMTQSGEPYFKPNSNNPTRDKNEEVEIDELIWKVPVGGQPPVYVDAKSAAQARASERKLVRRPQTIGKITRVPDATYKQLLRKAATGKVNMTAPSNITAGYEVEVDEGNVKGKGEWMPYLGQYSGEKERVDKQKKREAQAKDKRDQDKAPVGKQHEETVDEVVTGKFVVRGGQKVKKFQTSKPGFKLQHTAGASPTQKPREVKISSAEKQTFRKSALKRKSAVRSAMRGAVRRRKVGMKRASSMGLHAEYVPEDSDSE